LICPCLNRLDLTIIVFSCGIISIVNLWRAQSLAHRSREPPTNHPGTHLQSSHQPPRPIQGCLFSCLFRKKNTSWWWKCPPSAGKQVGLVGIWSFDAIPRDFHSLYFPLLVICCNDIPVLVQISILVRSNFPAPRPCQAAWYSDSRYAICRFWRTKIYLGLVGFPCQRSEFSIHSFGGSELSC
jgi:hypothetical protein